MIVYAGPKSGAVNNFAGTTNEVDLIVVASHGHKGVWAELGSTAKAVQQHASCEVEVVPAAGE